MASPSFVALIALPLSYSNRVIGTFCLHNTLVDQASG